MSGVHQTELCGGGLTLSALTAEPPGECRGSLLALHGGGARAAYWDSPVSQADSLVRLASQLGWRVLAPDRPGYGASFGHGLSTEAQAELFEEIAATWLTPGTPLVVVGHSLGAIVSLRLAARNRGAGLAGVAVGGVPLVYTPEQSQRMLQVDTGAVHVAHRTIAATGRPSPGDWYGPEGTYDERVFDFRRELVSPTPSAEFFDARDAPVLLPPLLGQITVPIQWAVAEHERTAAPPEQLVRAAEAALVRAPVVESLTVHGSGHNMSLAGMARSYHLRVLAFAEQARVSFLTSRSLQNTHA